MAKLRTHYQNLKVDRKAPNSVIKAAYRALSLEYHPDRKSGDPDAERIFKLIQQSYEILTDPFERKKHDDWIAQKEGKTTQKRSYGDEEKDGKNRERDTKKENKSNYTTVRKTSYFSPAFVVFLFFAIGSTYQMWEWSRTGAVEDFLDQYLERRIDKVSTSSDSIVADSNEVVTIAPVIESRRLPFRITNFITSLMSSDEQEPEVTPEKIISPEVIETEQIINDVTAAETSENLFADALQESKNSLSVLNELYEKGLLTDQELELAKRKIRQ